ncbi:MAG TPA: VOC family protein [Rariglobus sp.]
MSTHPTDYPGLSPYLTVNDAAQAIAFYKNAFGATERYRLTDQKTGKVVHAELLIEGGLIMLAEENPQWGNQSPSTLGGTAVTFCVMVKNTDAAFDRAVKAGATVLMPVADQFYGFRSCSVRDPFGHQWMLQHQIEKVSTEEMQKRWDALSGECPGADAAKK